MKFIPAKLAGRCCDGFEKGQGSRVHALINATVQDHTFAYGDALCKAKPGRRSVGWSAMEGYGVTCPKCLKKMPTHWMDSFGNVATNEWLQTSDKATSDYRREYNIPCIEIKGKVIPIAE
jgi:hypothetical protein